MMSQPIRKLIIADLLKPKPVQTHACFDIQPGSPDFAPEQKKDDNEQRKDHCGW
jgi:hypothetical protein